MKIIRLLWQLKGHGNGQGESASQRLDGTYEKYIGKSGIFILIIKAVYS